MAAEAPSLPVIEEEEIDDGFYEKIEAPKFVDFTAPKIRRSHDDRYWFCLRVGCDRNHEEELDSEAIYKNFVLRVMAARSPNVRLRKAMNKRDASANLKCPLTAPAKPSKSRVSRVALISSLPKKIVDDKARTRPPSKVNATPKNSKVKQSSATAKAFTTPTNQKKSSNLDLFRTVQSKKALNMAVPKNRVIAKTLVFHSPKKAVKIKSSVELKKTPMKSLCSAMKKLEIDGVKKKKNEEEASRRKIKGREVKSRVFDSLYPNRCLKEKKKLKVPSQKIHEGGVTDENGDSSDMEIDEKSRDGSLERCHESSSSEEAEKKKICEENEEKREKIPDATKKNDNKENSLACDDDNKENEGQVNENDDKENVSAPDENNRTLVINHDNLEKPKNEMSKTQKKHTSNATTWSQVVKYKKLRPTNPKPFKLRTDERGILKETNLEKKPLSPLKETATKGGKTMRKHHHLNQKNEQNSDNNSCEDRITDHGTEEDKSVSIQCSSVHGNSNMKVNRLYATPQRSAAPKLQKAIDMAERSKRQNKSAQKLDDKFKRKSHMTQPTLVVRSRSDLSRKKENSLVVTPCKQQLSVIDEKSSNLQPNEAAKACNNGDSSTRKAYSANSSSRSRQKKTITVPKEPNFQSLHVPKSCTKKLT